MTLKELREKRGELGAEIRRLADLNNDNDHEWSSDDEARWTDVNSEYDELGKKVERLERAQQVDDYLQRDAGDPDPRDAGYDGRDRAERQGDDNRDQQPTEEHRALALQAWCRSQEGMTLSSDHEEACRITRIDPRSPFFDVRLRRDYENVRREFRAQSTAATAGGETIPTGFVNDFERALLAFGGMRQVSDVMRTASGNNLHWPTTNDTGNTGAILAENTQVSEQDVTTAEKIFEAYKYTSNLVRVSHELLNDSAFNLASVLGSMLGERIGRITNTHFTTGTGTAQPNGIVTASTAGPTAAANNAIAADELIDLVHSVDPAYRSEGGLWFIMNDDTVKALRKLKDLDGQYLWRPGLDAGQPDSILNYPISVNQDVADIGSNAISVVFGATRKYKIRDVEGFRLRRLTERYADFDQEGFVAFSRHDGDLLDAGTNPVKHLVHPA